MAKFTMGDITALLSPLSGNTFVGVTALTVPSMSGGKKNPHMGRITIYSLQSCKKYI